MAKFLKTFKTRFLKFRKIIRRKYEEFLVLRIISRYEKEKKEGKLLTANSAKDLFKGINEGGK
jgi:hypothetical protein